MKNIASSDSRLYDIEYFNSVGKTKLSLKQVINKFFLYVNIKYNANTVIICAWNKEQVDYLVNRIQRDQFPFVFVDYGHNSREWYIHYNNVLNNIKCDAVVDDVTGSINL